MLKIKVFIINGIGCLLMCFSSFAQYTNQPKKIESVIYKVLEKAYNTTVKIVSYDSVKKMMRPGGFSGVVVSADGYIMTAAHATKVNESYMVIFPNGEKHMAVALGRIDVGKTPPKKDSIRLDLSILKINKPGNWAYANLASSTTMKVGELCVSISRPSGLDKMTPSVRVGLIKDTDYTNGSFESTCKMEPGDSGGGLFNSEGKLIGIHSWIDKNEEQNFEIPVDLFKKYWSALLSSKHYTTVPNSDIVAIEKSSANIITIPPIQQLVTLPKKKLESSVTISSLIGKKKITILGTMVTYEKFPKSKTYIVSKNSMVGNEINTILNGSTQNASVVSRDITNDLVLLEVNKPTPKNSVNINAKTDTLNIQLADLGNFLVSAIGENKQYVSVLSDKFISVPRLKGNIYAKANFIDKKITITDILKGGSADGILKVNDIITRVNGIPTNKPSHYGLEFSKYYIGDTITVDIVRDEKEMQVEVCYLRRKFGHISERFAGGKSVRYNDFKRVLAHDGAIKTNECGSPVFNKDGAFYGINIARISRTTTIMLPYDVIRDFLNNVKIN